MSLSVFDLFRIGIGPSSSHTVGPMRAALSFVQALQQSHLLSDTARVKVELFGSLGATGKGHGSPKAVILGLQGEKPETVDVDGIPNRMASLRELKRLDLLGTCSIEFIEDRDLILHTRKTLPHHSNGLQFTAFSSAGEPLSCCQYYSVGGGFVVDEQQVTQGHIVENNKVLPYPFKSAAELLQLTAEKGLSISQLMLENELCWRPKIEVEQGLDNIWVTMNNTINRGLHTQGVLPGGLKIKRRAPHIHNQLASRINAMNSDSLVSLDWVSLYALAVNEENASGGRVVTAPTNGAAGIIPAVMRYVADTHGGPNNERFRRFLLTAGAIGILYKENASISGAEVGCQGEVGSACSMAAGALAEVLGGTPEQVENAAEIAMEHNLGLTCDPIGGLVQVPCIERNAMAAIKAISAARLALRGDGRHFVSLDKVIKTMRETGKDMKDKYKETARGGLATNVIEVPVNIIEC